MTTPPAPSVAASWHEQQPLESLWFPGSPGAACYRPASGAPTPRMMGRERMVMEPGLTAGPAPGPQSSPGSGSLLSILGPAAGGIRVQTASRPSEHGALRLSPPSLLSSAKAAAFSEPQPVLKSSEPQRCKQEGGGPLANINPQAVCHFSFGEPQFALFPGNRPRWALLGGSF